MFLHDFSQEQIKAITVLPDTKISDCMAAMSTQGVRMVLICQTDGTFWGLAADGDIRRYLVDGGNIDDPVSNAGNVTPTVLHETTSRKDTQAILKQKQIEYLPMVQNSKIVQFFALLPYRQTGQPHAVIMAGGLGSRLRPLTENCPKPLIKVAGTPILTHSLRRLIAQGIEDFTICINYLGDMIIDQYGNGSDFGVSINYVREEKRMGTGGALGLVTETLSDPFLVMNGDIITDLQIADPVHMHKIRGWKATMVTREHRFQIPYGVVDLDESGIYQGSREKPEYKYPINTGIYVLDPSILSEIPKGEFFDLPKIFDVLHAKGIQTGGYRHAGQWIDIGNPTELERANTLFQSNGDLKNEK